MGYNNQNAICSWSLMTNRSDTGYINHTLGPRISWPTQNRLHVFVLFYWGGGLSVSFCFGFFVLLVNCDFHFCALGGILGESRQSFSGCPWTYSIDQAGFRDRLASASPCAGIKGMYHTQLLFCLFKKEQEDRMKLVGWEWEDYRRENIFMNFYIYILLYIIVLYAYYCFIYYIHIH